MDMWTPATLRSSLIRSRIWFGVSEVSHRSQISNCIFKASIHMNLVHFSRRNQVIKCEICIFSDLAVISNDFLSLNMTRSFPGEDTGSDHDLLMMTLHLRLKTICEPEHRRLNSDLEKLKDPNVLEIFQALISGKLIHFTITYSKDTDLDTMINTLNTTVTETATEILGKHRQKKNPWVNADILDLCNKRRELRKKRFEPEGSEKYKEANNNIKSCTKMQKKTGQKNS